MLKLYYVPGTCENLPLLTVPRQVARELIYAQRMLNRVP